MRARRNVWKYKEYISEQKVCGVHISEKLKSIRFRGWSDSTAANREHIPV